MEVKGEGIEGEDGGRDGEYERFRGNVVMERG